MSSTMTMTDKQGKRFEAFAAEVEGSRVAVIVLQEWWGLNDQIKGVCRRLAKAGFTAISPDLYKGKVALDVAEAEHLSEDLDWISACDREISAVTAHLGASYEKVAILGFCMGGGLAVLGGARLEGIDGVVAYYGLPPLENLSPDGLKQAFLGHFAIQDDWITPAVAADFMAHLKAQDVPQVACFYDAGHAFANEEGEAFSSADAELSWVRTIDFLNRL